MNQTSDLVARAVLTKAMGKRRCGTFPRYCAAMKKQSESLKQSITGPMLKPLLDVEKASRAKGEQIPAIDSEKLQPAAEYQDDGGGYNSNFVFPQE